LAAALALILGTAVASPAAADKPVQMDYTFPYTLVVSDVCPFPVTIDGTNTVAQTDHYDKDGALTLQSLHILEQDTFTANGKTLVGVPFTFNMRVLWDENGNVTHAYSSGVSQKIPLPDGSLFIAAGHFDFMDHGFNWTMSPDHGNPGDIAAFCAALAP
jgi:hypothetical protein